MEVADRRQRVVRMELLDTNLLIYKALPMPTLLLESWARDTAFKVILKRTHDRSNLLPR